MLTYKEGLLGMILRQNTRNLNELTKIKAFSKYPKGVSP
jgi:hypothetical protein